MPSDMPYRKAFGSWGKGLKAAGLKPTKFIPLGARKNRRNKKGVSRIINHYGYVEIFEPKHPLAKKNGYVFEHRMVAYNAGILKDRKMQVHHKNEIKTDNRLKNLEVTTCAEHTRRHWKGKKRKHPGLLNPGGSNG